MKRNKKKLFDDSESEEEPQMMVNQQQNQMDLENEMPRENDPIQNNRSNLVNKMFYKDQNKHRAETEPLDSRNNGINDQPDQMDGNLMMNPQLENLMQKKQAQLDKAIEKYHNEVQKLNQ